MISGYLRDRHLPAIAGLFLIFVLSGCEPSGTSDVVTGADGKARVGPAVETESVQRAVAPGDRTLVLKGFRGSILLEGTDSNTADLEFIKRGLGGDEGEARESLNGIRVTEEGTSSEYTFSVEAADESRSAADLRGRIPSGVKLRVEHAAGPVSMIGVKGPIRVEHQHGEVDIRGAAASVNVEIQNGDVSVEFDRLPTDATVNLSTANGDMMMAVPPDASLQVEAETSAGDIFVRGLVFDPQRFAPLRAGARYIAQRGAGDVSATLRTENGSIVIRDAPGVLPDGATPADTAAADTAGAPSDTAQVDTSSRAQLGVFGPSSRDTVDADAEMPPPDSLDPATEAPELDGDAGADETEQTPSDTVEADTTGM
ncbi:DUF4097 family beta strand repeat-containing protein [Longibacter sp.]|uniref:DUF4097 family beta strand repeat-containing protein n=1 Tax=Longibacter sp. TaxID=2045415 RepID=UPI003EB8078F